jgi:hypothetical protein
MVAHMDRSVGAQDKEPNNMGNIENQLVAHSKEVRGRGNQMPEGRNVMLIILRPNVPGREEPGKERFRDDQ